MRGFEGCPRQYAVIEAPTEAVEQRAKNILSNTHIDAITFTLARNDDNRDIGRGGLPESLEAYLLAFSQQY